MIRTPDASKNSHPKEDPRAPNARGNGSQNKQANAQVNSSTNTTLKNKSSGRLRSKRSAGLERKTTGSLEPESNSRNNNGILTPKSSTNTLRNTESGSAKPTSNAPSRAVTPEPEVFKFTPVSFTEDFRHTINGRKVTSDQHRTVFNPANKQALASAPVADRAQLDEAIDSASAAFPSWAATPIEHRQAAVRKLGQLIGQFMQDFKVLLTKEQGKPIDTHSGWELGGAELWCYGISQLSLPDETILDDNERIAIARHMPLGVVAAIIPWNFPVLLLIWKIAPALVAGNTVIVKPSPFTPLCALKFVELAQQVLPPGVLSCLNGDDDMGPWLTSHPKIAKVAFTGSTATGKLVLQSAAGSLKRVTMELGGNDPAIVMPDVNPKAVAMDLFRCMFNNAGQLCAAAKRVYIHEKIYDQLRDELVAIARQAKVGDGLDPTTMVGPIQNPVQYEKVKGFIADCKANGYNFAVGGEVDLNSPGYFIPITIIDNPPDNSKIVREEPFGPIIPIMKWRDEEEVIRRANDTEYGLAATIWTNDIDRANRMSPKLDVGTVWINDFPYIHPAAPFAGHKMSGFGVENGKLGLQEYTSTHVTYRSKTVKY
ncbi:Aldedh-domain-containing protein [Heliocybe sulcata]|uniref:Aldedh-domain-containing protein n=1 Tax=Heliocybe sulcata TaxID=5364 RepID=A0A5C3N145_9AGAM|nr:Aldedh-domain-containing protein [Heliocybe sulcata]